MPQTRKPAGERRAEIVGATLALLAELPPDKLSTARIAARVGLSQPALFRHFPSKDDLWTAVVSEIAQRAGAAWDRVLATEAAPPARLRGLLAAQLGLIASTPAIPVLIFAAGKLVAEDAVRPIQRRMMATFRQRLIDALDAASEDGSLTGPAAPADAALLLMGLLQGLVLRWSLAGRDFDLAAEGRRLIALQLELLGLRETEAAR